MTRTRSDPGAGRPIREPEEEVRPEGELGQQILASIAGHLAVLDTQGTVIAVNDAWRDFGRENTPGGAAAVGLGANYLEVCRQASDDDPAARLALRGIEEVLEGAKESFTLEYPCHSPKEERWFSMTVTALKDGEGAVVVHSDVTDLVRTQEKLKAALDEVARLKDRLQAESEHLQEEVKGGLGFDEIVGRSDRLQATLRRAEQVARTDATVLLLGETGSGKEILARAIHSRGRRAARPLIKVDCANLPSGLIESELFGHEKGAFTGAHAAKTGRFELADGGTVFLDEVGELPLELQTKLLRVLDEGNFVPLGSKREHRVDVRVVAATNRDLQEEVRGGLFRADLYYRMSVFPIQIPPLRERREDIPLLVSHLVSRMGARLGRRIRSVAPSSMDALVSYDWPGNVRELQNVVERSMILCTGDTLTVEESLGGGRPPPKAASQSLKEDLESVERADVIRALEEAGWKIKGPGNAASRLGLKPSTLRSRMTRLGIQRPSP